MFFPLLKVLDLKGFVEILYLPPNNWENKETRPMKIYAIWSDGNIWRTELQKEIEFGQNVRFDSDSVNPDILKSGLCLMYPTPFALPPVLEKLPEEPYWFSNVPDWRATSGLMNDSTQTSYQSELFPLPSKASMLTFHPFIQFNALSNYLLVLNIIREPIITSNSLEIFNSTNLERRGMAQLNTNSASIIHLDEFEFSPSDLPLFLSRKMAGIPFGLGVSRDCSMLSLEHTHPPASLVILGDRSRVQGNIKKRWIERIDAMK